MRIRESRSIVLVAALVVGVAGCSSSANSAPASDAGGADAGGTTEDSGGTVGVDAGNDSGNPGSGGCLGGGDVGNCVVTVPAADDGGGGACITGDFCTSADGLNSAVEQAVIACETLDTTAPTCSKIPSCVFAALARACPDPTTATQCGIVVSSCSDAGVSDGGAGAVTLSSCEQILAGFNVTTRTVFANCWAGSCDLDQCVSNLFAPP
jgi:hypothetical protein